MYKEYIGHYRTNGYTFVQASTIKIVLSYTLEVNVLACQTIFIT